LTRAKQLTISKRKDEFRAQPTDKIGGVTCIDEKTLDILRTIAKDLFKKLVGKIFTFNFNLTTISFPIHCMRPLSLLESFGNGGCTVPLYLNKAWGLKDPVERMKYVITMQISTFRHTSSFLKPVLCFDLPSSLIRYWVRHMRETLKMEQNTVQSKHPITHQYRTSCS
jgi:hypothetical protein